MYVGEDAGPSKTIFLIIRGGGFVGPRSDLLSQRLDSFAHVFSLPDEMNRRKRFKPPH